MTAVYCPGLRIFREKDLELHTKLGEGTYGTVHMVREKQRGKWLAVKKIAAEWFDYDLPPSTMREIATLAQLPRHPNIVALEGVLAGREGETLLCFELCRGGDLHSKLQDIGIYREHCDGPFAMQWAAPLMRQVALGIAHLHSHGVVHRDLKPMNILVSESCKSVKICDFGMARVTATKDRLISREAMTTSYRAPEVALSSPCYGKPCDVWSAGLIFAEVMTGTTAFDVDNEVELLVEVFRTLGTPTEENWPGVSQLPDWQTCFPKFAASGLTSRPGLSGLPGGVLELVSSMVVCCPAARITIHQALDHPFLREE